VIKPIAIAGVAGALMIAGCAPAPLTKADVDGMVVCDEVQMDQVERHARHNATLVLWVRCPVVTLRTT